MSFFNTFYLFFPLSLLTCGKLDKKRTVVRLCLRVESRSVSAYLSAFFTFVDYNKSAFCVGLGADRSHKSSTFVGSVARIYINVKRPQAEGAMIPRGIAQGKHFPSAMGAGEAVVKF